MSSQKSLVSRRHCLQQLGGAALAFGGLSSPTQAATLAKVQERGVLNVGIYEAMPPFHVSGKGIDVELAQALAKALDVKLALMPFVADDNMNDDLRNMVWRGTVFGYGPADVLMHVPVEQRLMDANPQVKVLAPYYRDRVMLARSLEHVPNLESMAALANQRIAVTGVSLSGWLMLGADGGAYKNQLTTKWKDGAECALALLRGDFTVAAGMASELESVLRGNPKFAIEPMPTPRAPRDGWAAGLAVKSDNVELAQALQAAMNQLSEQGKLREIFDRHNVSWRGA
jgi:ABC-type amino acid transport substrate-binding protein